MTGPRRILIAVGGQPAGILEAGPGGRYLFAYGTDCPRDRFVSLTMPVRLDGYRWHELHPVFQTGLPDGAWGGWLREQLALAGRPTALDLLLVAGVGPGRVSVSEEGSLAGPAESIGDLRAVLAAEDSRAVLRDRVEAFLATHGLDARAAPVAPPEVRDAQALYRAAPDGAPDAARVEAWCLRIARRAGIEVPDVELSSDQRILRVKRSDGTAHARLGRDDGCTLQGLGTAQRYAPDPTRLVSALATFVSPVSRIAVRREVFRRLLLGARLGDRRMDLRGFSLLYESADGARLAPLDALATTELKRSREAPAPLIPGRAAKRRRGTWRRFASHCALALREAEAILEWQAQAVADETAALEREVAGQAERVRLLATLKATWAAGAAEVARYW